MNAITHSTQSQRATETVCANGCKLRLSSPPPGIFLNGDFSVKGQTARLKKKLRGNFQGITLKNQQVKRN